MLIAEEQKAMNGAIQKRGEQPPHAPLKERAAKAEGECTFAERGTGESQGSEPL